MTAKGLLLLDTHVWLWLINGDQRISGSSHQIDKSAKTGNVKISVISVWEIAMLESRGRVQLPGGCRTWIMAAFHAPGVSLAELTPQIAMESVYLPRHVLSDPSDQMIVATACCLDATLVTADKKILAYMKSINRPTIPV